MKIVNKNATFWFTNWVICMKNIIKSNCRYPCVSLGVPNFLLTYFVSQELIISKTIFNDTGNWIFQNFSSGRLTGNYCGCREAHSLQVSDIHI